MASLMKPKSFLRSSEGTIASYSYTDLMGGSGEVVYYAGGLCDFGNGKTGANLNYILSKNTFYADDSSNYPYVENRSFNGTYTYARLLGSDVSGAGVIFSVNFYTPIFNIPQTMKGTLKAHIPASMEVGTGTTAYSHCILEVYKVLSGGTNIFICSGASGILSGGTITSQYGMELNIPQTNIGRGDRILLKPKIYFEQIAAGTNDIAIFHDPTNSTRTPPNMDARTSNTQSKFTIPFKIDI